MTVSSAFPAHRDVTRTPEIDRTTTLAQHREQTERVLASIRTNAFIDDRERARRITQAIAAANARFLELTEGRPRLTVVPSRRDAAQQPYRSA